MNDTAIQIRPASNDSIVLSNSYVIRVQCAILQHIIQERSVKLTATGRFNRNSAKSIFSKIAPLPRLTPGILNISHIDRESDVYRLSQMRERLLKLGTLKVELGKISYASVAIPTPSQIFNQQYLTEIDDIFVRCADIFKQLKFKSSDEFLIALASGVSVEKALQSVSSHVKTHAQQKSTYDLIIKHQVMYPLEWIGLVERHPMRTTPLWNEVVFIG
jgi:hypothetical protein